MVGNPWGAQGEGEVSCNKNPSWVIWRYLWSLFISALLLDLPTNITEMLFPATEVLVSSKTSYWYDSAVNRLAFISSQFFFVALLPDFSLPSLTSACGKALCLSKVSSEYQLLSWALPGGGPLSCPPSPSPLLLQKVADFQFDSGVCVNFVALTSYCHMTTGTAADFLSNSPLPPE